MPISNSADFGFGAVAVGGGTLLEGAMGFVREIANRDCGHGEYLANRDISGAG
jgi:hypothetical protein